MNTNHGLKNTLYFYYEGEESEVETEVEVTPPASKDKTFTQEELNTLLAKEKRTAEERARKQNDKTIKELETLKKTVGLTEEEKQRLEQRIEDIKNDFLTKEQLEKKRQKEETERTKHEKEQLSKDRDTWKNRYHDETINRELVDAAVKGEAHNPDQVLQFLKPNTRLVEELDSEEKSTGRLIPKVRLAGKDKDGNVVILELSATDAVKQMKDMPEHGNLFRSGAHSGVGGTNNNGTTNRFGGPPTHDTASYRQWRKNQSGLATRT